MPSSSEPCVKGTALALLIDEARLSLNLRKLPRSELQSLSHRAQELVEHGVVPSEWYPVRHYAEMAELLCATSGLEPESYLRALGEKDFVRLRREMTYRQLSYLSQVDVERTLDAKLHDSRLIVSMMGSIFNFSRWAPAPDPINPKHMVIRVTDAEYVPEAFRILTEGFQTTMNRTIKPTARAVRSERVGPDVIIFRSNGPKPTR